MIYDVLLQMLQIYDKEINMNLKRKVNWKRNIAALLAFVMLISMLPSDIFAEEHVENTKSSHNSMPETDDSKTLEIAGIDEAEIGKDGEVLSERTANSKLFYEGEGVFTQEVYPDPIHIKESPDAEWEDISPELKATSEKRNRNGKCKVRFNLSKTNEARALCYIRTQEASN